MLTINMHEAHFFACVGESTAITSWFVCLL